MSHQPFEHWILDGEPLGASDRRALQAHLDDCASCRRLQNGWQGLQGPLRAKAMIAPAPGFTRRWQEGLPARRAKEQRRQAWKIFGIFLAATLLTGLSLAGYMMVTTSPTDWLAALASLIGSLAGAINFGVVLARSWLNSAPLGLTIVLWIYLTVCLCLLSLTWVAIVWRTSILGVFNR